MHAIVCFKRRAPTRDRPGTCPRWRSIRRRRALGRSAGDAAGTPDPSSKREKTANVTLSLSPALRSHSPTLEQLQSAKALDEFGAVDVLGQGMVGLVLRAKHRTSGKVCAIKTMPKSQIMEHGEEEHCMAEAWRSKSFDTRPLCNYYAASFQDPWALYLVMEDCVGDMFDLFNQSGLPGIGQIKVYTAQVLLGLEYIHSARVRVSRHETGKSPLAIGRIHHHRRFRFCEEIGKGRARVHNLRNAGLSRPGAHPPPRVRVRIYGRSGSWCSR